MHGAKGREWDAVLVIRANEDTMPLSHGDDDEGSEARLSEERRLMYVAMTRGSAGVSYVATGADSQPATASRFLRDLPADETVVVRATHYEMRHAATDASGAAFALPNAPTPRGGGGGGYGGFGRTPGGGTAMSPRVAPADLGASSDLAARLGTWQGRAQQREDKRAAAEKKKQPPSAKRERAPAAAGGGGGGGSARAKGKQGGGRRRRRRQGAAGREDAEGFVVADDDSDDDLFQ